MLSCRLSCIATALSSFSLTCKKMVLKLRGDVCLHEEGERAGAGGGGGMFEPLTDVRGSLGKTNRLFPDDTNSVW